MADVSRRKRTAVSSPTIRSNNHLKFILLAVAGMGLWLAMARGAAAQSGDSAASDNPSPPDSFVVAGQIRNGTTDQPVTEETPVTLHVYDDSFAETETMTTLLDADGRFQFTLDAVEPDWVYMATMAYKGLDYNSNIAWFSEEQTALQLPLTVFDQTTDAAAITIGQLRIAVEMIGDRVQVSELATFNNGATAVFMGQSGLADEGTARLILPAAAQDPTFQRGFGGDNFFPADELIQTADGWADTIPLRPGPNSLTLLATYFLPELSGLELSRPLLYNTRSVTLVLPDGLTPGGAAWQQQPTRMTASGVVASYSLADLSAGQTLTVQLDGQPASAAIPTRGESSQWLAGAGAALLMAAVMAQLAVLRKRNGETETAGRAAEPITDR